MSSIDPHGRGVSEREITRALRRALFDDAVSVIGRGYGAALTVDNVASEIATSRRQLQRVFAVVGNTTFRAYLTSVRMHKAAELLADHPALTVREVARSVGYHQPPQFAKAFRRVHGVAPAEYKLRVQGRAQPALAA